MGFTLASNFWRKGYATEAVQAVIAYYSKLGITSVWASTDPKNEASMKVLRTLGFSLLEAKPDDMLFLFEDSVR